MGLDLADYELRAQAAVRHFWQARAQALASKMERGTTDQGNRAAVTAGTGMGGFEALIQAVVEANGLPPAAVFRTRAHTSLPGFYRMGKSWDVVVVHQGQLVAAIECKSQIGSIGNNANNRLEEALGAATDFWKAWQEGAFGASYRPLLGYLLLLEDSPQTRQGRAKPFRLPHFAALDEFQHTSYADRYDLFCRKVMQSGLYGVASVLLTNQNASEQGLYGEVSVASGLQQFVALLAGHIATVAALPPATPPTET